MWEVATVTSIVGVHGIGNLHYFRRGRVHAINADWTTWLGSPVAVAYYAQHLHRGVAQGAEELDDGEQEMLVALVEQLGAEGMALGAEDGAGAAAGRVAHPQAWAGSPMAAMAFCREAHTYLARPASPRRAAAEVVAGTISRFEPRWSSRTRSAAW